MAHLKDLVVDGDARIIGNLYSSNGGGGGGSFDIDKVYPVGSIYMNVSNVDPGTLFGGTWVRIQDTFLLSAGSTYAGGSTGGNPSVSYTPAGKNTGTAVAMNAVELTHSGGAVGNHTLTTSEMPSHSHGISRMANSSKAEKGGCWVGDSQFHIAASRNLDATTFPSVISNDNLEVKIGNAGSGGAHNHPFTQPSKHSFTPTTKTITQPTFTGTQATIATMPPYLTVYMWKRTA